MTQDEALNVLKTGANVFLTGEPGSGKTHTVNRFVGWLREHGVEPAVTASTGIAATHINGRTIHSWSGIGIRRHLTEHDLERISGNKQVVSRIRAARVLIIDEISMLSAQTFGMVGAVCRAVRGGTKPFGGMQVVLVGDFFQLPPIIEKSEDAYGAGSVLFGGASVRFAFDAPAWKSLKPAVCYLSEQYRQEDIDFLALLSAIRSGRVSAEHRAVLGKRLAPEAPEDVAQFFSHNADVDRINEAKLSKLPGLTRVFSMKSSGSKDLVEHLKKGCLSPESLLLKTGACVMFTKNDITGHRFVNGTMGTVTGFSKNSGCPVVKTNAGRTVFADPAEWVVGDGGRILARIEQVPLRLAWAITVHKSQGMSLDAAHMDLSDAFEHGQGYVAISRVRSLVGLSLGGFNERALEVHPEIAAKDKEFRRISLETQANFAAISLVDLRRTQDDFVRSCAGRKKAYR